MVLEACGAVGGLCHFVFISVLRGRSCHLLLISKEAELREANLILLRSHTEASRQSWDSSSQFSHWHPEFFLMTQIVLFPHFFCSFIPTMLRNVISPPAAMLQDRFPTALWDRNCILQASFPVMGIWAPPHPHITLDTNSSSCGHTQGSAQNLSPPGSLPEHCKRWILPRNGRILF